ncbi:MAG: hypothetical protein ACYCPR_03490 [Thermoplasmataceae archaeon]
MKEFEVLEHIRENKGKGGKFILTAISFLEPAYVKVESDTNLEKGDIISVQERRAYRNGNNIGLVIEHREAEDVRVSTDFDIKYTGGYSLDGKTIYLDEHFPILLKFGSKVIDSRKSIGLHHELPEKWLSDDAYEYPYAHEIATGIEKKYVEHEGVTWKEYCAEVDMNLRNVYSHKLGKTPVSLDLAPYLYCRDREALKEIRDSSGVKD